MVRATKKERENHRSHFYVLPSLFSPSTSLMNGQWTYFVFWHTSKIPLCMGTQKQNKIQKIFFSFFSFSFCSHHNFIFNLQFSKLIFFANFSLPIFIFYFPILQSINCSVTIFFDHFLCEHLLFALSFNEAQTFVIIFRFYNSLPH